MNELKVNYTYFILTGGIIPEDSIWYRGFFGNLSRNNIQGRTLKDLWKERSTAAIGEGTEFIIRLLQCSEYWPDYAKEYDPVNTYDTALVKPVTTNYTDSLKYDELIAWSSSVNVPSSERYRASSSKVEKITSALYNVLTVK